MVHCIGMLVLIMLGTINIRMAEMRSAARARCRSSIRTCVRANDVYALRARPLGLTSPRWGEVGARFARRVRGPRPHDGCKVRSIASSTPSKFSYTSTLLKRSTRNAGCFQQLASGVRRA